MGPRDSCGWKQMSWRQSVEASNDPEDVRVTYSPDLSEKITRDAAKVRAFLPGGQFRDPVFVAHG